MGIQPILREARQPLVSLLRGLIPLLVLFGMLNDRLRHLAVDSMFGLTFSLLGQSDIYHALFYAALPALGLLLLLPLRERPPGRPLGALALAAAIGLAALWLLGSAPGRVRPGAQRAGAWLAAAYVALNLAGLVWFHACGGWTERSRRLVRNAVLLADLAAPMLVWSTYRREGRAWPLALTRLPPAAALGAALLLPWLYAPLDIQTEHPRIDGALARVSRGGFYQASVDPADGRLFLVDDGTNQIWMVNPRSALVERRIEIGPQAGSLQACALDQATRRVICVAPLAGQAYVIDADALRLRRTLALSWASKRMSMCRSYWDATQGILAANCTFGSALLCADGATVIAAQGEYGSHSDLLIDPQRPEIHVINVFPERLVAFDGRSFAVKRYLPLHPNPNRLALDERTDRLFVSYPISGEVQVIDAGTYQELGSFRAFVGVRAMGIDQQRGWLLLSGLSPIIEVRSLRDFALLDRLWAPPWMRWVAVDEARGKAYVTTPDHGAWALNLALVQRRRDQRTWVRRDPFFALLTTVARLLQTRVLGWSVREETIEFDDPVSIDARPCPERIWTDADDAPQDAGR